MLILTCICILIKSNKIVFQTWLASALDTWTRTNVWHNQIVLDTVNNTYWANHAWHRRDSCRFQTLDTFSANRAARK